MNYLQLALAILIGLIGVYMMTQHPKMTPPFLSGAAFILIAISLSLLI